MSLVDVVRKDVRDVRRAKLVWIPVAVYTLFMVLFFWGQTQTSNPDFHIVLLSLGGLGGTLVVPLIALVAAYLSIAGERESGSIKYLLGLPNTRTDVVLGKLLSRSAIVFAGLALSFVVGAVVALVFVPEMTFNYGDYVAFLGLTLLYALAYVTVAVAISAATASRSRAIGGAIGFFFVFNLVWNFLPIGPAQMIEFVSDEFGLGVSDDVTELIFSLSPTGAYLNALDLVMPDDVFAGSGGSIGDVPFYLENWFMLVILLAWVAVPLALGTWRFRRADIA